MPSHHFTPIGLIERPQRLQGKLTYAGVAVTLLGILAQRFGVTLPEAEVHDLADWIEANWDSLAKGFGLILIVYGRLRREWRH